MKKKNLIVSGIALLVAIMCWAFADCGSNFWLGAGFGCCLVFCLSYSIGSVAARRMESQVLKAQRDYIEMARIEEAVQKSE